MQIPLENFEQYIDNTILQRGYRYFKNGHVRELEEITPGKYQAIVEGTEDYTVTIHIQDGVITEHICDCPYDMGPVCKHVVAVIFELQQDDLGLKKQEATSSGTRKKKKPAKRKTIADKVNDLLEKVSPEELKDFVRETALENIPFRNSLLTAFPQHISGDSKSAYKTQVRSILRAASKRGFIDWSAAGYVGKAVSPLLDIAEKQLQNRNFMTTINICTAVMEPLTDALQYSDDSGGYIGDNIRYASELLYRTAEADLPEKIRRKFLNYCLSAIEKEIYEGWDWHTDMMRIAAELIRNDEEARQLLNYLDEAEKKESDFFKKTFQNIRYDILLKIKGEEVANAYLEEHLNNSYLRGMAIQKAMDKKDYDKAIVLAKDGIKYDRKDRPGLVTEWNNWLLKIAQARQDTKEIIHYARFLLIDSFSNEQDYYQILKDHIPPDEWESFVEEIVKELKRSTRYHEDLLANIFIREEWWDRLLELVKEIGHPSTAEYYESYLKKLYPEELAQIYERGIFDSLQNATGRKHYQTACRYIRKIKKLGLPEKANEIVESLRALYPRRPALLEELNQV